MELVKLSKWGNSSAIRIPKNILKSLNISDAESDIEFELNVSDEKQIILTKKVNNEENYLETLFKNYEITDDDKISFDWGSPRGTEII